MSETPTFGRYAEIPVDKMTAEQKEGYQAMMESRGRLPGPNKIWIHNPRLAKVIGPFGAHFQAGRYSLSEREREIAVCVVTSHWRSRLVYVLRKSRPRSVALSCHTEARAPGNVCAAVWRDARLVLSCFVR